MLAIVGILLVLGGVVGGYLFEEGNLHVLYQPAEVMIIFGAAIGSLLIATPFRMVRKILKEIKHIFLGAEISKQEYTDLLLLLNSLFSKIKVEGAIAIEQDIEHPENSNLFAGFKSFLAREQALRFLCDNLRVFITVTLEPHEFEHLMDIGLESQHEEDLQPSSSLNKVADALPGLGIVAAVLGVVITMGKIDEPPEVLGHAIGAALVGTFLGVLSCYGFVGPMATNLEHKANEEIVYIRVIKAALLMFVTNFVPQIAVEAGRRAIPPTVRPTFQELEQEIKRAKKAAA